MVMEARTIETRARRRTPVRELLQKLVITEWQIGQLQERKAVIMADLRSRKEDLIAEMAQIKEVLRIVNGS
jgi:hypothetical protein